MLLKKCPCDFNCDIQLEKDSKQCDVTIFENVLSKFLNEDIIKKYPSQPQQLEVDLLVMESIDFTFSKNRVITNIVSHNSDNDWCKKTEEN